MSDRSAENAWIARVLGVVVDQQGDTPETGSTTEGTLSIVKLSTARLIWGDVRAQAVRDITAVGKALAEMYAGDDEQLPQLKAALTELSGIAKQFNTRLEDQLDAVLNADGEARLKLAKTARDTLNEVIAILDTPIMRAIDHDEVKPDVEIAAPMRKSLSDIAAALG